MKILMWSQTLPELGGVQTLVANLVPELRRRGHQVVQLSGSGMYHVREAVEYPDDGVHRLPMDEAFFTKDLTEIIRCRRQIESLINEVQPQLIHFHATGMQTFYYLQICQRFEIPSLATVHNNLEPYGISLDEESLFGQAFRKSEWISAVSRESLAVVLQQIPELAPVSTVIENGVPAIDLQPAPLPWTPPRLLFAGRFSAQKRVDILLEAFAILNRKYPHVQLTLAGQGELQSEVEDQVKELGIGANTLFTGQVPPERVLQLLNDSTILVLSSDYEGLPMIALEAGQMARPVVATRVGGLDDIVEHGKSGLLADPGDPAALAAAIESVLQDPQLAAQMGQAGRRRVKEQFSIDHCAAQYEAIYQHIGLP